MAVEIASINSGSNGNCYYVGNQQEAVLIDIGLSCRETEIRMKKCGLDISKVKAIFVSHEHHDHIKGVSTLAHKYKLPVYITPETALNGPRMIKHLSKPFSAHQPIDIGSLQIIPFKKEHDAADPHSFVVSSEGIHIGVITDIGTVCEQVIHYFSQCHAAFLESNYDEVMLKNGPYSELLKARISGGKGHISNRQAIELFSRHRSPHLSHLMLAHLSKENNSPELAKQLFENCAGETHISVASRYEAGQVYNISTSNTSTIKTMRTAMPVGIQKSLFD